MRCGKATLAHCTSLLLRRLPRHSHDQIVPVLAVPIGIVYAVIGALSTVVLAVGAEVGKQVAIALPDVVQVGIVAENVLRDRFEVFRHKFGELGRIRPVVRPIRRQGEGQLGHLESQWSINITFFNADPRHP